MTRQIYNGWGEMAICLPEHPEFRTGDDIVVLIVTQHDKRAEGGVRVKTVSWPCSETQAEELIRQIQDAIKAAKEMRP